jgi:ElaB/YqjD/DUF883 family membrane-anchored ribosome-binding protein
MDSTTTSTRMKPRHSSNAGSEEIMADIAETRANMDETLDQLSERLQPRHILDDILDYFRSHRSSGSGEGRRRMRRVASKTAGHVKDTAGHVKDQVKEKASDAGHFAFEQVKQHPLPAVLIGAGIVMLLMERNRGSEYDEIYDSEDQMAGDLESGFGEMGLPEGIGPESYALPRHYTGESDSDGTMSKLKNKSSELKQKAGEGLQNMKQRTTEKTAELRRRASERGAQLKEKARHGYEQSYETIKHTAEERPLALGLGFLAIGVVAGMLLPSTRKEDELVGPTRDRLVNRSREVAEDVVDRGKQVARTAYDVAAREAREQGLTPEALKEKTKTVASQVKETTREDAQRQQREFTQELKQS